MTAIMSEDGLYRYRLERRVVPLADPAAGPGTAAWIMVNPSTADAVEDDPTIRKVCGFTARMGGSQILVGNLFAFRATNIRDLRLADDPVGPENDRHLEDILRAADIVIVGWGNLTKLPRSLRYREAEFLALADRVGARLYSFGTTGAGDPRHPCMTGYDTRMKPWPNNWRHLI